MKNKNYIVLFDGKNNPIAWGEILEIYPGGFTVKNLGGITNSGFWVKEHCSKPLSTAEEAKRIFKKRVGILENEND